MSIKCAEITITFNAEKESIFTNFLRNWLTIETFCDETSNIIILFDDDKICCVKDDLKDCKSKFKFFESEDYVPLAFNKKGQIYTTSYFNKKAFKKDDENFNTIVTDEIRKKYKLVHSIFNCIYYCYKSIGREDVLAIVKIDSNEDNNRFLLFYDSEEFNHDELIYIVNCIFTNKYK